MLSSKRKLILPVTLVAIVLGFLISLQINTHKNVTVAGQINQQRIEAMKTVLNNSMVQNARLQEEHRDLDNSLEQARQQGGTDSGLLTEISQIRMLDGTQAVQGPGIVITIDDRKQGQKVVFPITTDDLLRIINTLKFAGAEAISLNGQRIVSVTAIVLSGSSTILVNQVPINRPQGVPYEIMAIGNQDTLEDYVSKLEAASLKQGGIAVNITRKIIQLPSYKGSYTFSFAQ
ncbi:MAG: DUF881 domain-containing protein [Desulfitobacteriaceae bacterium]|nr:DUF881 domain-containing protein [Desulfitobacteriaceae bacterium]MDD4346067.1 DUF881 domain-containing protein [Desulfitobacteriaceae bacterium]MDD4401335.1 DUF881 domain-containing protein [Desulfitobacteriaceae bacterium]